MAQQLRVYTPKDGKLEDWVRLYEEKILPLRTANGFRITAWTAPRTQQFVWLVERDGTVEEFEAADRAYYEQPEHKAFDPYAREILEKGESWFLDPVEAG
jgi:hypothetical protein